MVPSALRPRPRNFLALCLVWCGCLLAGAAWALPPVLPLDGTRAFVAGAPMAEVLEDPPGTLTFADVRNRTDGWRRVPDDALAFGYTRSAFWVRWRLENASAQARRTVVDLGNPREDFVHWHVVRGDGRVEDSLIGDRVPFAQRTVPTRTLAHLIELAPHERVDLYVRLASHDGLFEPMPVRFAERLAFIDVVERENLALMLFHGGIIALGLYNLLLFVATRERAFGLYVLYLASFVLWSLTSRGFSLQYLWPTGPAFNNNLLVVAAAAVFACIGCFADAYLNLRHTAPPRVRRVLHAAIASNALVLLPIAANRYALGAMVGWVTGLAVGLLTIGTAVWLLRRGSRQARFYVIAFSVLLVGTAGYILSVAKVLPPSVFTTWGVQIGSAIEVLLLALGLADSMNMLKLQKLEAEQRERLAQQALAQRLEHEVAERTQALEAANQRLRALSITDELTGAFNRRHFKQVCDGALVKRQRSDPLAFCMFDIDHFKAFNDLYGHAAGDQALRAVSDAVRAQLKRSGDVLFRLGGEEFGVLFSAATPEGAQQFVERLRHAVRELRLTHAGCAAGFVTASFGVAWWGARAVGRLTPDQMYAASDDVLYAAKAAGRDRVSVQAL